MGNMSEECTLLAWGVAVVVVVGVLFTVSTDDTCAVGRVLCSVCTLCSEFTLFAVVIEFTVFAVITFTLWWVGLCTVVLALLVI